MDKEKSRLDRLDSFQILEYIRSSIEVIMSLKVEDLEKEMAIKKQIDSQSDTG